ncbi:DUF2397 family protein [Lipingzhangella sp. LS1_29]|uniref:DUF2397 family protein n=1 Tax=Lipingzhangella rawalii TaxID=2055835 RepID=A0ABU2H4R8_9ACTN|nr:DUF2397 family protein [Lipingzhangella rawalii]MDS1270295.1 DUF2397 family protein [Lipingzhangella rawalii]
MGELANRLERPATSAWDQPAVPAGTSVGRPELLRLAAWFDAADADTAHVLFTTTFRLYPAQWLAGDPDDPGGSATNSQIEARQPPRSWWTPPPRESSPDDTEAIAMPPQTERTRDRLRAEAEAEAHWRRAAATEVRQVLREGTTPQDRSELTLSRQGRELLVELLGAALGGGAPDHAPRSAGDLEYDIRVHVVADPEATVVVRDPEGELTLNGVSLWAGAWDDEEPPSASDPAAAQRASGCAQSDARTDTVPFRHLVSTASTTPPTETSPTQSPSPTTLSHPGEGPEGAGPGEAEESATEAP